MKGRMTRIERALISVSDKEQILRLARVLTKFNVHILSSGGTAQFLRDNRIKVTEVSEYTAQAEILGGRVKTLHPKIHGGILARRSDETHLSALARHEIKPIDMVVVNLYPFEKTIAKPDVTFEESIENIDIGGPSLIRAAAKNWEDVTVIVSPDDYGPIVEELENRNGLISQETRFKMARKAFALTARYDGIICDWFHGAASDPKNFFSDTFNLHMKKKQDLRYGENPHQKAAFYAELNVDEPCVTKARQVNGKELSFNNILDLDGAIELVKEFEEPVCVILKHTTACGVARSIRSRKKGEESSLKEIFIAAREVDPLSAFGGIIGFNRPVDPETASEIVKDFFEVVVAPGFDPMALLVLKGKKNLRVMELPDLCERLQERKGNPPEGSLSEGHWPKGYDLKKVVGGLLVQERNLDQTNIRKAKVVTKRQPNEEEWEALAFAWKVVKHIKSNAVVFTTKDRTMGIGAGQMSRVDAAKMAIAKVGARYALPLPKGTVMASEAFFPFRDSIDEAAKVGVTAVIHPGGSLRDEESIQAADEANMAMVFTGIRHFRH